MRTTVKSVTATKTRGALASSRRMPTSTTFAVVLVDGSAVAMVRNNTLGTNECKE